MSGETSLAEVQRWMLDALHQADGGHPAGPAVLAPSPTMTAGQCLDVYRRGYRLRLLETLWAMHPALRHLTGDELFDAFALDYLAACRPSSYSLFRLGDGFADHLAATRPDSEETWPDLLIDVARFERAFLEVYDGRGAEGGTVATSDEVPSDRGRGRFVTVTPVPCLRVLRSRFPVGEYVRAVRRDENAGMPAPRPTYEALVRRNYVVDVVPLTARSCPALETLLAGADVAGAARAIGASDGQVLAWVRSWAERGLFTHITLRKEATCS
jgi:hypothetical protein